MRIVSIDPGIVNIGWSIWDDQVLLDYGRSNLQMPKNLEPKDRLHVLAKKIHLLWQVIEYHLIDQENGNIMLLEENDVACTKDFNACLAAFAVASYLPVRIIVVRPEAISKWLGFGSDREAKKQRTVDWINQVFPGANFSKKKRDGDRDICDSIANKIYYDCRIKSNPKLKREDHAIYLLSNNKSNPDSCDQHGGIRSQECETDPVSS